MGYLPNRIALRLKSGDVYTLDLLGNVLHRTDSDYQGSYSVQWKILGFLRRWNSGVMISLRAALDGGDIGHGYVVDLDHGTRRVWGHPSNWRAVSVKTFYKERV